MKRILPYLIPALVVSIAAVAQVSEEEVEPEPWLPDGAMGLEALQAAPVRFELNVPYGESATLRQCLDLYLPLAPASDTLPVIVYIHGGGWRKGDKATGAEPLVRLVRDGQYAGVSVAYRLSGEATWPAQIHDVKAAIRWIRAHAGDYGFDSDRIVVYGRSAGGHLALMLGVTGGVAELEGDVGPHPGVSSAVSGVVNWFGPTEFMAMIGQATEFDRAGPDAPEALLLGGPLPENEALARAASPVTHVTPDDAPVLTIHGTEDWTVPYDQAVRLHDALARAGVTNYLIPVEGGGHGNFPEAADARTAEFFAKVLLGRDIPISTQPLKSLTSEPVTSEPSPVPRLVNPFLPQVPPTRQE